MCNKCSQHAFDTNFESARAQKIFSRPFKAQNVDVVQNKLDYRAVRGPFKLAIFSIHYFFAEGKKVKGMVRNDVFGGWDR